MHRPKCGPDWLDAKIAAGETIILDGAMGTELEAHGVDMHNDVWSAAAQLSRPDAVKAAHIDYIRSGADVIITNTFSAGRQMLEPAGLGDDVAAINKAAVQLAIEAREEAAQNPVAIAGSICEWVHIDSKWLTPGHLREAMEEQAGLLAEAGVDVIAVEMCQSLDHSPVAVEAALTTGLPVWVGMSCRRLEDTPELMTFDKPHGAFDPLVKRLAGYDVAVMSVMHSPIADTSEGLEIVRRHWQGPLGVYPESGYFIMPNWQFVDVIAPDDLVRETGKWIDHGASLIGGCCGLGPAHIAALKQAYA